jgi:drug/metabolite transporter (DMT)-like permease
MLYLILAILTSSGIVVLFRLFDNYKINNIQAITVNYAIASILGFVTAPENISVSSVLSVSWFPFALLVGITLILVFNVFALSSQKAGVAITAVSSKMSVVIPVSIGILFYHDFVNIWIIFGIITSLLAFYLTFKKKKSTEKVDKRYFILPLLLFIGNGSNDSLLKHSQKFYIGDETELFLSTAFLFSFVIGSIVLLIDLLKNKRILELKNITAGVVLGLLNYASTYFFIKGLSHFQSSVFFPIFNVSIVMIAALVGYFVFKEKLSKINWLGIFLALSAILMITLA